MARISKKQHEGSQAPAAGMADTYVKICSELDISPDDASAREIVARVIIDQHRSRSEELATCLATARKRLYQSRRQH